MASLECPCGYLHDLDPQPDSAWLTLLDTEYDALEEEIVRYHTEDRGEEIQSEFGRIYECPECGCELDYEEHLTKCTNCDYWDNLEPDYDSMSGGYDYKTDLTNICSN